MLILPVAIILPENYVGDLFGRPKTEIFGALCYLALIPTCLGFSAGSIAARKEPTPISFRNQHFLLTVGYHLPFVHSPAINGNAGSISLASPNFVPHRKTTQWRNVA
jgi:hypothetical protein